jgi:hypothetical protein
VPCRIASHRSRVFAVAGAVALLGAVAAVPAAARPARPPVVDVQSLAGMAPDGRSMTVQVLASCPERWTVVEAVVAVSQPQGSGRASFPLTCIGSARMFTVTVASTAGTFELGTAQVNASVVIRRGSVVRAQDAQLVQVEPTVVVELADTARLERGGAGVLITVSVACPAGTTGLPSTLNVSQQGRVTGNGSYTPICDGLRHTFSVSVQASEGLYQAGIAQALTFANVEHEGNTVVGVDDDGALELVP